MKRKPVSRGKLALAIQVLRDVHERLGNMRCTVEEPNDLYKVYIDVEVALYALEKEV